MSGHRVAVAYSGGRDSTALLHATLGAAAEQGIEVLALHVHHGLSAQADAWLLHTEAQCRRWARAGKPVTFVAHRLTGQPAPGDSVEAWARQARYGALRDMAFAHDVDVVLLAHHQRDQAETFVLQGLRGAGPAGLSGMPVSVQREGICWERPWLDRPRGEIDAYVRRHRLRHIEDDSNTDPRFARNRLRLQVWPALVEAFPQADASFARAATWAQHASLILEEVAVEDLRKVAPTGPLMLAMWRDLSAARRSQVLRVWIRHATAALPSASLVERLLEELVVARQGRWLLGSFELRLYRGALRCQVHAAGTAVLASPEASLSILAAGQYELPGWGGRLEVAPVPSFGIPLAWLAHLELRPRSGGENFQAAPGRPVRGLKKQFQAARLPAWERDGPLIYSGGQLVFVPGLGIDARVVGLCGQQLMGLRWRSGAER